MDAVEADMDEAFLGVLRMWESVSLFPEMATLLALPPALTNVSSRDILILRLD